MTCPDCGSTNTGDAAAATYADSVCKDCGKLFMHEEAPTYRQPGLTGIPDDRKHQHHYHKGRYNDCH